MTTEQLGRIVEDAASEIYIFSASDCRFLLVNRGARENLGYTVVELRNLTPWDLKPEFDEHSFREMVAPLSEGASGELVFETIHRRKDGSHYDVSVHLQCLRQEGQPVFFAAIRDVTEQNLLKRELVDRGEKLEEALRSREILLQEVNHRVKNSLQLVTALLQLHARKISDPSLRAVLRDAQNRIAVVASIHQRLYMNGEHSRVDVGEFLRELVSRTIQSLETAGKVETRLQLEDGVFLGIDQAVPLALIVSELVTNALKYAFDGRASGTLGIDLRTFDQTLMVKVWDDGIGHVAPDAATASAGLGTQIIEALSKQIRATLTKEASQCGTSYELQIALR